MHGEDNVIILKVAGLDEIRVKWWRSKRGWIGLQDDFVRANSSRLVKIKRSQNSCWWLCQGH